MFTAEAASECFASQTSCSIRVALSSATGRLRDTVDVSFLEEVACDMRSWSTVCLTRLLQTGADCVLDRRTAIAVLECEGRQACRVYECIVWRVIGRGFPNIVNAMTQRGGLGMVK
jgi:hypothetical protein